MRSILPCVKNREKCTRHASSRVFVSRKVRISKSAHVKISMPSVCLTESTFSAVKDSWLIDQKISEKTLGMEFDLRHFIFNV